MKRKILVILGIFIIILIFVIVLLYNYNIDKKRAQSFNNQYEVYYDKTIFGTDLATLLNKVADYNEQNEVPKDSNEIYYLETENSIFIEIKFIGKDEIVKLEDILFQDIENFIKYYASENFKCAEIKYHEENGQVKSLYFEQI